MGRVDNGYCKRIVCVCIHVKSTSISEGRDTLKTQKVSQVHFIIRNNIVSRETSCYQSRLSSSRRVTQDFGLTVPK